jgi:hypothetical protein
VEEIRAHLAHARRHLEAAEAELEQGPSVWLLAHCRELAEDSRWAWQLARRELAGKLDE